MMAKKLTALLVDDDERDLKLEKDLLEVAGFEVLKATDGAECIDIARKNHPDVIIMNVQLADMRGAQAVKALRQSLETCDIPIVLVTPSSKTDGGLEMRDGINTGLICKPINARTFARDILRHLPRKRPLILLVDDQAQNNELLEARLTAKGYDVIKASGGVEALEIIQKNQIDLILLDIMMPDLDGFEVTRRVRQSNSHRLLPIILVTALTEMEDRVRGIDAGCDDFISKPVDNLELQARVRSLLKVKAYNDLLSNYRTELEADVSDRTRQLRQALENLKDASLETIYRLSMAAEYRDKQTGAHIMRMSLYSAAIARRLGMDEENADLILYGSPMHDLGKIGIPDRILLKPSKLDSDEWEIMKHHTVIGARILNGSDARIIKMGEEIAQTHHEKWDGSGYPSGLKGAEIPIAGRVAAIADVFDALTSRRPYKEAFSPEYSLSMIREGKGVHFDPDVVDAFLDIQGSILEIKSQHGDDKRLAFDFHELKAKALHQASHDRPRPSSTHPEPCELAISACGE